MSRRRHPTRAKARRARRQHSTRTRTKSRSDSSWKYGHQPTSPEEARLDYIMDQVAGLVARNLPRHRRG